MALTFANQQSKLSRLLQDSGTSSDDAWPLADRQSEINRGELKFARDSKILWGYETGTISGSTLSLPSDWLETHVLTMNNIDMKDREIGLQEIERYEDSGGDFYYTWVNASNTKLINFLNTNLNGKTYKLFYFRKPSTDLSDDSDESVFPDEYREASVYWAASELLFQVGQSNLSDRYQMKYQELVEKARSDVDRQFINREYAVPDLGDIHDSETDIQGSAQRRV